MAKKEPTSQPVFTRVKPDVAEGLGKLAERYRVSVADILRWMIEDAVAGQWTPSHLKKLHK